MSKLIVNALLLVTALGFAGWPSAGAAVATKPVRPDTSAAPAVRTPAATISLTQRIANPRNGFDSDGEGQDRFAHSVAISGDTAVVATPYDAVGSFPSSGSVRVFVRSGQSWTLSQKLVTDTLGGGFFALSVAIDGDTLVVGVHRYDSDPFAAVGGAFVYTRAAGIWSLQQQLWSPTNVGRNIAGDSVAIDGDRLVIGAGDPSYAENAINGHVHVYRRSAAIWSLEQSLVSPIGLGREFGSSLALSGNTLWVGDPSGEASATANGGVAFVFGFNGAAWLEVGRFSSPTAQYGDQFGRAIAMQGDLAIVGALRHESEPGAYTYARIGGTWQPRQVLGPSDFPGLPPGGNPDFGAEIALSSNWAVVTAPRAYPPNEFGPAGAVAAYRRAGNDIGAREVLQPGTVARGDEFGWSVAISDSALIVGSPGDDVAAFRDQGTATVYDVSTSQPTFVQALTAGQGSREEGFGSNVALTDNWMAVAMAKRDVGAALEQGSVLMYQRAGAQWILDSELVLADGYEFDGFGTAVAFAGNALFVSSNRSGAPSDAVVIYERVGAAWQEVQRLSSMPSGNLGFGRAIAGSGSLAFIADNGVVTVFRRGTNLWQESQRIDAPPGALGFGNSLALSNSTLVVGAPGETVAGRSAQGAAYVYGPDGSQWTLRERLVSPAGAAGDNFGHAVAVAGDAVLVGAWKGEIGAGRGFVEAFHVQANAWQFMQRLTANDPPNAGQVGHSLSMAGNVAASGSWRSFRDEIAPTRVDIYQRQGDRWIVRERLEQEPVPERHAFGSAVAIHADTLVAGDPQTHEVGDPFANWDTGALFVHDLAPYVDTLFIDSFD